MVLMVTESTSSIIYNRFVPRAAHIKCAAIIFPLLDFFFAGLAAAWIGRAPRLSVAFTTITFSPKVLRRNHSLIQW